MADCIDRQVIQEYILSVHNIMKHFKCEGDFYIKPLIEFNWTIQYKDNFSILSYWDKNNKKNDSVIVKKKGRPMIFESGGYTMIIGIDCVKTAFIFENSFRRV